MMLPHLSPPSAACPRPPRPAGFTLVELLVVISVILILASLLLPTITSSFKSAVDANCVSNLRQIGDAFLFYVKQYRGFMPPSGAPPKYPRWHNNLEPFLNIPQGEHSVFACPAKDQATYGYGLNHMWNGPDHIYPKRAMNDRTKEINLVRNAAGTIIIADTGYLTNNTDSGTYTDTSIPVEQWVESDAANINGCTRYPYDNKPGHIGQFIWWHKDPRRPFPRHGVQATKTTCLFFDGHVEAFETTDIVDDMWNEPGCLYDNDGLPPVPDDIELP